MVLVQRVALHETAVDVVIVVCQSENEVEVRICGIAFLLGMLIIIDGRRDENMSSIKWISS